MSKFVIYGQKPLAGEIKVYGAKNAAMKMIAASILVKGRVTLNNVPDILDIQKIILILQKMGAEIIRKGHLLSINTANLKMVNPDADLVQSMRASVVLVGPLLARFGKVQIPHPGGCTIGRRPIDLHLKAFRELGVKISQNGDDYQFELEKVTNNQVRFKKISVTATENIILFASSFAQKITIFNAATEPEIIDLINFLKIAGAKITIKKRRIDIFGSRRLEPVSYQVMPDRIEAGTLAILAATSKSNLKITNLKVEDLASLLEKFRLMQIGFEKGRDFLYVKTSPQIQAVDISTAEYPGFPTDLQSPMGVLLTQATGNSRVQENIFEHRLEYLKVLQTMGAKVKFTSCRQAEITGPTALSGRRIESLDLRSGASLLIAGLIAKGKTEISNAEIIDRGYEKIEERLQKIGADIKRIE